MMEKLEEARILAIRGRDNESIELLSEILDMGGEDPDIYLTLAGIYRKRGNREKALEICQKALQRFPGDAEILEEKASLNLELKNFKTAAHTARIILGRGEDIDEEIRLKARSIIAFCHAGDPGDPEIKSLFEYTVKEIDEQLKHKPGDEILLKEKASLLRCAEKHDESIGVYKQINETEGENLFVPLLIARVYMEKGDYEQGERILMESLEKNGENFRAYRNLAWYWREMGKKADRSRAPAFFDRAAEYYEKAKSLSDLPIDTSYNDFKRAHVYYLKWNITKDEKDRTEALESFDKYMKRSPEWISTDGALPYISHLKGGPPVEEIDGYMEIELTPAVK